MLEGKCLPHSVIKYVSMVAKMISLVGVFVIALMLYLGPIESVYAQSASTAVDDTMYMTYRTTDTVNLLTNDTLGEDYDHFEIVTDPGNGVLSVDPTGEVKYSPIPGTYGYDMFEYALKDSSDNEVDRAVVYVTVRSWVSSGIYHDLYVYKTDGGVTASTCGVVKYALVYDNVGPSTAPNAFIKETLPMYTSFVASESSEGWTCSDNEGVTECILELGDVLPSDPAKEVYFALMLDSDMPIEANEIENVAFIGVVDEFAPDYPVLGDSNPASNTSTDMTPLTELQVVESCNDDQNPSNPDEEIPVDPTDPKDPTEPADPTDPTDPSNPADPDENTNTGDDGDVLGTETENSDLQASTQPDEAGEVLGLADTGMDLYLIISSLLFLMISSLLGIKYIAAKKI